MCRNIRTPFNVEPPVSELEIRDAEPGQRRSGGLSLPGEGRVGKTTAALQHADKAIA
jgi:hypothetical protein